MSKDTERDVLIYKRLEEELIKPAAGMGEKVLSPGDTKYLFISPLKFNSFFFFSLLFLKWRENGGKALNI